MFTKLALDDDGHVKVTEDGKPIYEDKDGKEVPVDAAQMYQKIIDLGKENKGHREKAEKLQAKVQLFDEIEDIEAWHAEAVKAMETVANFNEKDWLKAEKVDSMKRQMKEAHEAELQQVKDSVAETMKDKEATIIKKDGQIRKLTISAKFAASPLFTGEKRKTTMTPDAAEAIFGHLFTVEEDEKDLNNLAIRGYYSQGGEQIYSIENPGEPADFNEAMGMIWERYPQKNNYIRGDRGGSGAQGGAGGGEPPESDDIATLQKQYDEAIAAKQTSKAISLKNKIHAMKQKARAA